MTVLSLLRTVEIIPSSRPLRKTPDTLSLIIDIHGYAVVMPELLSAKAHIFGERGWSLGIVEPNEDVVRRCAAWNIQFLDEVGTDLQLIGARPYHLSCGREPAPLVRQWTSLYNRMLAAQCAVFPARLRGLAALPQCRDTAPADWVLGLADLIDEHDFVGVMVNPDPGEGDGLTPGLGDPFWYPVWETLVALELPAVVVSGAMHATREGYSNHYISEASIAALSVLENVTLFRHFPELKLIITYGGGSLPFQIGRWRARRARQAGREPFDTSLRRLYFDTVVHTPESMDMLFSIYGADRCLFGTQRPGAASAIDAETGRAFDDLKPIIQSLERLSDRDRHDIFEDNARRVFPRLDKHLSSAAMAAEPPRTSIH
jgi:predicted TIM-barrel fold metal-dependent hydrolase